MPHAPSATAPATPGVAVLRESQMRPAPTPGPSISAIVSWPRADGLQRGVETDRTFRGEAVAWARLRRVGVGPERYRNDVAGREDALKPSEVVAPGSWAEIGAVDDLPTVSAEVAHGPGVAVVGQRQR